MPSRQTLFMFSVPVLNGIVFAIVPEPTWALARQRLCFDDPVWNSRDVYFHWGYDFDVERYHCRVKNRIKFWYRSKTPINA